MAAELPLIVIVGPTASGKTRLAIDIALACGGEIICADSRTVYRYMDIGTAKPTLVEQAEVPHWGLDLVEPGESFSAAAFKQYASVKIDEIRRRGHVPIMVGGTGLYVDAVLFDYQFGPPADPKQRQRLEELSVEELQKYCIKHNISLPENQQNKRHLIRAIERKNISVKMKETPIDSSIIVGIATERDELRQRISLRAEQLFQDNVVDEATRLGRQFGWENEAMTGNIYPLIRRYLDGELSLDEAKEQFVTLDWRLAKRQLTWLRRNPYIAWLGRDEAKQYLLQKLASEHKS